MAKENKKKGIVHSIKQDNANGARRALLEELFQDFHRNRREIYTMNLIRGFYFGLGTVIGGTLFLALVLWVLNLFIGWFPALNDLLGGFNEILKQTTTK